METRSQYIATAAAAASVAASRIRAIGKLYDELMRELNAKSDEVVALSHQQCDQDRAIQYTEAELQNTQHRLFYRGSAKRHGHGHG